MKASYDLLITGGEVVLPKLRARLDVAVQGGKVAALATTGKLGKTAKRIIDARGLYIFPGAIDPHTHIQMKMSGPPKPGFDISSVAAAYGGTTCLIDFAFVEEGDDIKEALDRRCAQADGNFAVDYSFHPRFTVTSLKQVGKVGAAVTYGAPSFGEIALDERHGAPADNAFLLALFQEMVRHKGIPGIHAENDSLIKYFTDNLLREGKHGLKYFPASRPNIVEEEAVKRTIYLAEKTGAALYFFHLSSWEALQAVTEARKKGMPVYAETCPHYLAFNDSAYSQEFEKAIQFIRFPPIRSAADQAALWRGVKDGTIDCIGTDHVAAFLSEKKALSEGKAFNEVPGGMGQVENRLNFMFSEGVAKGRISVQRLVEVVSTNVAKIFGLYPRKGTIAPGSDADMVLFDPKTNRKITTADLHMGMDYTIYEGWNFTGSVVMTLCRGKVIIEDGKYIGSLNDGKFIRRKINPEILKNYAL